MTKHVVLVLGAMLLLAGNALALTTAEKCESQKLKLAGKYGFCRLTAESKAIKKGEPPDYSKCDATYGNKWTSVEDKAGGTCTVSGDQAAIRSFITQHANDLAAALEGGALPTCASDLATCNADLGTCGGDLSAAQTSVTICTGDLGTCNADLAACSGDLATALGDLGACGTDLATCVAAPRGQRVRTGQALCYSSAGSVINCAGTGQDGELLKGLTISFADNGDGTITDHRTGLMWEKLGDDGSIHDKDTAYTWATAFSTKIATLNSISFAGHNDWRLPNVNELQSLVNYGAANPSVHPPFHTDCTPGCGTTSCSCTTPAGGYWTSTNSVSVPGFPWVVSFSSGSVFIDNNLTPNPVRAVRDAS